MKSIVRPISIGVQAATMIDCNARVPLLVFAKRRKIDVKDPVDLASVRRGRLIHAAFEDVATRLGAAGALADEAGVSAELSSTIARALPDLDVGTVAAQATSLAATIAARVTAAPAATIMHERRVSVVVAAGVKLSGRIDTIVDGEQGMAIIERKTGFRRPWHARQVQLYADMVEATWPGRRIAHLELWYSGREPGTIPVTSAGGDRLAQVRQAAAMGVALDGMAASRLCKARCEGCPRDDCGLKRMIKSAFFRGDA